jgi:hypothetical protein
LEGFVKGHDFSRADKTNEIIGALALEGYPDAIPANFMSFSAPV